MAKPCLMNKAFWNIEHVGSPFYYSHFKHSTNQNTKQHDSIWTMEMNTIHCQTFLDFWKQVLYKKKRWKSWKIWFKIWWSIFIAYANLSKSCICYIIRLKNIVEILDVKIRWIIQIHQDRRIWSTYAKTNHKGYTNEERAIEQWEICFKKEKRK